MGGKNAKGVTLHRLHDTLFSEVVSGLAYERDTEVSTQLTSVICTALKEAMRWIARAGVKGNKNAIHLLSHSADKCRTD